MKKAKIGFVGVGGMAEAHIKKLVQIETAELTSVFDVNRERAGQVGSTYGMDVYDNAEQMMDSGKVDALFICTPPFARGSLEEKAAAKGIHLLAEKPVGLDLAAAKRINETIEKSGIIHSSGYCLRYLETVQKAKQYLADKTVALVFTYRLGGTPPMKWWVKQDMSGGQMVEQGTHQIDLVRYLAGEFAEVHAFGGQRVILERDPDATISDVGAISFRMQSGAVGTAANSCIVKHGGRGDVELFGPDFYLSIRGHSLTIHDDNDKLTETCKTDYYLEQDRAFVEAVRTGRQELVLGSFTEAVATLEATLAFNESEARGVPVTIG